MEFNILARQNPWWRDAKNIDSDPKLKEFDSAEVKWIPRIKKYIKLDLDVLYSLRGPRQVGKTTLAKLIIREVLNSGEAKNPADIFYYSCDLITEYKELFDVLETYLMWSMRESNERKLIIIDEISRVKDWEYAYKHIIDTYGIEGKTFILTGSSCWDLKHGVERLPGRKGEMTGEQNHKILLPMKFAEYVQLRSPQVHTVAESMELNHNPVRKKAFRELTNGNANKWIDPLLPFQDELESILNEYFLTGGVMTAVNQYVKNRTIKNSTYELYLQLFFGDLAKLQRNESTAKKLITTVLRDAPTPVGWTRIHKTSGIPNQVTVSDYAEVLKTLFVLNIYEGFDFNKGGPKPRSDKKLQIPNPFFFHAFRGHIENPAGDYFIQAKDYLENNGKSLLAEFIVGDHLSRCAYNTRPSDIYDQSNSVFYSRNQRGEEIDFIVRLEDEFLPVEVKYQNTIHKNDYKTIKKHAKGLLITKNTIQLNDNHPAIPLPVFLMFI